MVKRLILSAVAVSLLIAIAAHALPAHATGNNPARPGKTKSPKASYNAHLRTAIGYGMPPIKNNLQLKGYVKINKLKTATCNKGCTINKLSHSKAYLVPKANKVLNEISKQFYTNTKSKFTVTSITRTLADQHRLRQVNSNARHGMSSHNFGCSYDISYMRFNGKKESNPKLEKALESILQQFQQQGKIYYIKEKWQRCFHVTVRSGSPFS